MLIMAQLEQTIRAVSEPTLVAEAEPEAESESVDAEIEPIGEAPPEGEPVSEFKIRAKTP
eukprot:SAG11_NODE_5139_length_1654_cov_1.357556_1_plen_60_part_00